MAAAAAVAGHFPARCRCGSPRLTTSVSVCVLQPPSRRGRRAGEAAERRMVLRPVRRRRGAAAFRVRAGVGVEIASAVEVINDLGFDTLTFLGVTVLVVPAFRVVKASPVSHASLFPVPSSAPPPYLESSASFADPRLLLRRRRAQPVRPHQEPHRRQAPLRVGNPLPGTPQTFSTSASCCLLYVEFRGFTIDGLTDFAALQLFEMGLELSLSRLKALAKFAFGMGLPQVRHLHDH